MVSNFSFFELNPKQTYGSYLQKYYSLLTLTEHYFRQNYDPEILLVILQCLYFVLLKVTYEANSNAEHLISGSHVSN